MRTDRFDCFVTFPTTMRLAELDAIRQFTDPKLPETLLAVLGVRRPGAVIDGYQIARAERSTVEANGRDMNEDRNAVIRYIVLVQYTPSGKFNDTAKPSDQSFG